MVKRFVLAAAAVALIAGCSGGFIPPSNPASPSFDRHRIFRDCPVASCAGYPDPAKIRGITISGLQDWIIPRGLIYGEISALRAWHANTVRFQVLQDKLVGADGLHFNLSYMKVLQRFVRYARRKHLNVVIAPQTEISVAYVHNELIPTVATDMFWLHLIQAYGRNRHVVFDLFNEPRHVTWGQWYAAMQPLATYVRQHGSVNQLWVEGIRWSSTFQNVPLLHGQGIVYSYHHPGSPWPYQSVVNPQTWDKAFGYLAKAGIPVVDGEFTNYIGGYYWPHATQLINRYFTYLRFHHIGLVVWSLSSGIMTNAHLTEGVREPQGDGRLVMHYFWTGK